MRKCKRHLLPFLLLAVLSATAGARPAYWHWWTSKVDGARICMQAPPGDGWRHSAGPYLDARCTRPAQH